MESKRGYLIKDFIMDLILRSYNYNMHVEGLLPANLCLVSLGSSEQCSQFEGVCLKYARMVNKTSSFETKVQQG